MKLCLHILVVIYTYIYIVLLFNYFTSVVHNTYTFIKRLLFLNIEGKIEVYFLEKQIFYRRIYISSLFKTF